MKYLQRYGFLFLDLVNWSGAIVLLCIVSLSDAEIFSLGNV